MNKLLSILILCFSINTWGDICSTKNCTEPREEIDICFVQKSFKKSRFGLSAPADCGYWSEKYFVDSISQIENQLTELASSCRVISKVTFYGHGSPGVHRTGLSINSVKRLKKYSCLLKPDINIRITGCNVGAGCKGDMFLHSFATNIFNNTPGSVNSPTFTATTILPGIIPSFSLNGRSRKLTYNSSHSPPESWGLTGLALGDGGSMAENCRDDILELIDELDSETKSALKRQCYSNSFSLGQARINQYKNLANRLTENKNWRYSQVERVLNSLQGQLQEVKNCSIPSHNPKGIPSSIFQ